ncbi:MAG: hypothetical protein MUC92_03730 [Fimbriimonadaceae bacterium]|jgi:aspartokinase|nr:hypothetical protein [Fimbriimonadaceae bacterium]
MDFTLESGDRPDELAGQPFRKALSDPEQDLPPQVETEFEKARGIHLVEQRTGLSRVHVVNLAEPLMASRLNVLKMVAEAKVSIDFLKFTPDGITFIVSDTHTSTVEACLKALDVEHSILRDRSVVLAHAANLRDEEGLIAQLVSEAIDSVQEIDHLGDMHDRLLFVVKASHAPELTARIKERFMEKIL